MIEVGQKVPWIRCKSFARRVVTTMRFQLIDAALWHFQAAVIAVDVAPPKHPMHALRN
jgi:hypothetical protein